MNENKTPGGLYYRSLTRNIVLTIIIVSLTPLILASGIILYQFQQSYREKIYANLGELVENHRQNIDGFLKQKLNDIRFLTKTFSYEEVKDESFLQNRLSTLQEQYGPGFVDLGVVNERGIQTAYSGPFRLGKALYTEADWFKKAIQREYFVSDVFLGLRGLPHFIVAVRDNWRGEHWILRSSVDFVAFSDLVRNIRIGKTGFAFILNREGELQTQPSLDIAASRKVYRDFLEEGKAHGNRIRITERTDESGKKNIYVAGFLKDGEWLLIYQQDASDAFADLKKAQKLTLIIILLGGLGILTMAFVLSRRLVKRIAEVDQEKEMMDEQIVETGKLASVGELAAGIAHEINNPVAIMVEEAGWIEDLLEEEEFREGKNLEEFKRALRQIHTQGKRCKEITYKLLSFARKTDSMVKDVQINEVIEEIVALSAQRAKLSNVVINTDFQEGLPSLRVSQSELQQVFLNLINNALDAMEKRGGTILLKSWWQDGQILVGVADNGPGIPKAILTRIFDPFFTTKPVGKGTGLGLSICYGIIKKLGGDIEVRSTIDVGTSFRVKIPLPEDGKQKGPFRDGGGPFDQENPL
ncbi:MAG: ATP-binding protein [Desulfobacterales bacterium]|nr:ATP-binding protein [Desulfobacterales bacterium]